MYSAVASANTRSRCATHMSEQTVPQAPIDEQSPSAPPPKQRFKEASVQSAETAISGHKRPLVDAVTTDLGQTNGDPTDRAAIADGEDFRVSDDGVEASKLDGKQPRIQPSLIKGIGAFRKPRVGSDFQAVIPPLQPKPKPP